MNNKYIVTRSNDELQHHGIKGQKWGVRRFQNKDGSLTPRGKQRYLNSDGTLNRSGEKKFKKTMLESMSKTKTYSKDGVEINFKKFKDPNYSRYKDMDLLNIRINNKNVGNVQLYKNVKYRYVAIVWQEMNKEYQGKGYSQAVTKAVIENARKKNFKKVTLELPYGVKENVRHMYEKMGFKEIDSSENVMRYDIEENK